MQGITWNDDLKLGIKSIDSHHRTMINIANEFINAANQRSKTKTLTNLLIKFREHVVSHLKTEERIMASVRYRNRALYSLESERFKVTMKRFQRHLNIAGDATIKDVQFFKKTLLDHIRTSNHAITRSMVSHNPSRVSGWREVGRQVGARL